MLARRYTILIADRSTGVVRRVTVRPWRLLGGAVCVLAMPVLIGLGARWSAVEEIDSLRSAAQILEIENGSYRAATGELTAQIQSLEGVIDDLGARAKLNPSELRAMQKLPAVVKARAAGGSQTSNAAVGGFINTPLASPEDTFGVLRDLLEGLESRLRFVRRDVEHREALAAATPSIWPTQGWLTGTFGGRSDPFTG